MRPFVANSRAGWLAAVLLPCACGAPTPTPQIHTPIRLAEILTAKNVVTSPLLGLRTARSPAQLADVPHTNIFTEGFETLSLRRIGWRPGRVTIRKRPPGKALHYRGGGAYAYAFILPVKPATLYSFRRGVRTSDPKVDLRVLETRVALRHPEKLNHPDDLRRIMKGKFVGMQDLLIVHRLPPARQANLWQVDSIQIWTTRATHSLVLVIDDAESVVAGSELDVWLDDLRLDELQPTRDQELALLAGQDLAEGADSDLGIVEHGQLLPVGDAAAVKAPFDHNFDHRYGLLAPTPTTLRFPIDVPNNARFSFSFGLAKPSHPGDVVDFAVHVETDAGPRVLYQKRLGLTADNSDWHWFDARVSLAEYAGQHIALALSTAAPEGKEGTGIWGSPIIDAPRRPTEPPNVVLIAVDTLRADHLSCYGNPHGTSPNLDALARDGLRFDQAVSASNWTTSAFASLFTGMMPSRHRVIHRARAIAPNVETLTEHFHDAGWLTQGIAYKAYLYDMGFEQGFDGWFNVPRADNTADDNLREALSWLDHNYDRRFFLFFHLNDPHQPFNQPPPFDRKFNSAADLARFGIKMPITIGTSNRVLGCARCTKNGVLDPAFEPVAKSLYDGAVAFTDDRIGQLIASLKARGVYDDTIIAFVADHGEQMWEHDRYYGHGGPYMTDELIRVPLIIKPQRNTGLTIGRVLAGQVRSFDLTPTLLELAGVGPLDASGIEARSLLPVLRGAETADRLAISENVKQHLISARDNGWKYVLHHRPDRTPSERLYRIGDGERANLIGAQPKIAARLRQAVISHWVRNRGGQYLLVTGPASAQRYDITVTTGTAGPTPTVQGLLGLTHAKSDGGVTRFAGPGHGPVVLLAYIDAPAGTPIDVTATADGRPLPVDASVVPYHEDLVSSLLATPESAAHRLAGAAVGTTYADKEGVNGDQLATLRALGYVQ